MGPYQESKLWLTELVGLSKEALHVYVGLTVFLAVALIFRLPLRDWRPWAAALLAAMAGELLDLFERLEPGATPRWAGNWHDLWNTMFWPTMLFALARWTKLLGR
jgi:hypothetical protein